MTAEQRQRMRDEYDAGVTFRELAGWYELAPSSVYHHVRATRGPSVRGPLHGTQVGWLRHLHDEQEPCGPCAMSHQAYVDGQAVMAAAEE